MATIIIVIVIIVLVVIVIGRSTLPKKDPTRIPGTEITHRFHYKRLWCTSKINGEAVEVQFRNVQSFSISEKDEAEECVNEWKEMGWKDVRIVRSENSLEVYIAPGKDYEPCSVVEGVSYRRIT
ncbi:hypothetical protein ACFLVL_02875 [Chloroflexota bacterium]